MKKLLLAMILAGMMFCASAQAATNCADQAQYAHGASTLTAKKTRLMNNVWNRDPADTVSQQCITQGTTVVKPSWTWNWSPNYHPWVKSYPSLYYGKKPFGNVATAGTLLPKKIVNVTTLTQQIAVTQSNMTGKWNSAAEMWIIDANIATQPHIKHEIMVWLDYAGGLDPAGTYLQNHTIDGVDYELWVGAAQTWTIYTYRRVNTTNAATINWKSFTSHLIGLGYFTDQMWIADIEYGNEPVHGTGAVTVDNHTVTQVNN